MEKQAENIIILITTSSFHEAERLAKTLVERRFVACGNIVREVHSIFWWKDSLETEQEALLILKSKMSLFSEIVAAVQSLHSYDVPEIIALPIIAGSEAYLDWLTKETQPSPT